MKMTKKTVWVVTMWQDDEYGSGSYVWKVCATKEKALEYASRYPRRTDVDEYELEE